MTPASGRRAALAVVLLAVWAALVGAAAAKLVHVGTALMAATALAFAVAAQPLHAADPQRPSRDLRRDLLGRLGRSRAELLALRKAARDASLTRLAETWQVQACAANRCYCAAAGKAKEPSLAIPK